MNKYFIKNQLIIILFLGLFSGYLISEFIENKKIINNNNIKDVIVLNKNCGIGNGAFSIDILYNKKTYNCKVNGKPCLNMNVGDKYQLFYSKEKDKFVDKSVFEHSKKGVIASLILLIISMLPFKFLIKKGKN